MKLSKWKKLTINFSFGQPSERTWLAETQKRLSNVHLKVTKPLQM